MVQSNGIFTLSGTETGTGTRAETTGNNRYQPLFWFRCNAKPSTQFHATHYFPVPVTVSVTPSVNTPSGANTCYLIIHRN